MPQSWLAFAGCFALVFSSEVSFLLVLIYSQLELSFWKKKKKKKCIAAVIFSSCILLCIVLTQCEHFNLFLIISISIPAVH